MMKKFLVTLSAFTAMLFATQLVLANELSSRGADMRQLSLRREELQKDIRLLKSEVASLSSLAEIEEKASRLGFVHQIDATDFLTLPKLAQAQ